MPYLLSSLAFCQIHEAIFVLDRCTDQSKQIIENAKLPFEKKIIELKEKQWHSLTAEPMAIGFKAAKGNMIFAVNADFYLDPTIFTKEFTGFDIVSFSLHDYPLFKNALTKAKINIFNPVSTLYERLRSWSLRKHYATGLYGISKEAYDIAPHCDRTDEDYYIIMSGTRRGFHFKFYPGHSLHLRPANERSATMIGERTALYNVGLLRAIWFTYKYLNMTFLRGYLVARASRRLRARKGRLFRLGNMSREC